MLDFVTQTRASWPKTSRHSENVQEAFEISRSERALCVCKIHRGAHWRTLKYVKFRSKIWANGRWTYRTTLNGESGENKEKCKSAVSRKDMQGTADIPDIDFGFHRKTSWVTTKCGVFGPSLTTREAAKNAKWQQSSGEPNLKKEHVRINTLLDRFLRKEGNSTSADQMMTGSFKGWK